MTYDVGNPGPGLGQAKNVAGLNQLMGYQPSPLDNWISSGNTDINNKEKNPAQIDFQSKRPHSITKMNDNLTMDSTIARSMNS